MEGCGSSTIKSNSTSITVFESITVIDGGKNNVSVFHKRMFKALTIQSHEVLPNISNTDHVKHIEIDIRRAIVAGCTFKVHFHDGSHKKIRVDEVHSEKHAITFTTFSSKYKEITTTGKFELSGDGKTIVKLRSHYHGKHNHAPTKDEMTAANKNAIKLFKDCEKYLITHPNICA